jgi:hypothetical protein
LNYGHKLLTASKRHQACRYDAKSALVTFHLDSNSDLINASNSIRSLG